MNAGQVSIYVKIELRSASISMEHTHVAVIVAILEPQEMDTVEVGSPFNRPRSLIIPEVHISALVYNMNNACK